MVGYQDYELFSIRDWSAELFTALLLMRAQPGLRVLDIGCASGTFLDLCQAFGFQTYGIEPSPWAQGRCRQKGHQIIAGQVEGLAASAQPAFDLVTAFHVVEHLVDLDRFFSEINGLLEKQAKFLAVFPNVDFSVKEFSGYADSFEHISYFSPKFVNKEFAQRLKAPIRVLSGPELIFVAAGDFDQDQFSALSATTELSAGAAGLDDQEIGFKLRDLSVPALAFVILFLARNHSVALARRLLSITANFPQWNQMPGWLAILKAFVSLQNGNLYGVANAIDTIETKVASAGLNLLTDLLKNEMAQEEPTTSSKSYPLISIWACCSESIQLSPEFLRSVGTQTYPNMEILHVRTGHSCHCQIPASFQALIETIDLGWLAPERAWTKLYRQTAGTLTLWADPRYKLSPYCLFALYHPLIQARDGKVMSVRTGNTDGQPATHFIGQRTLEKLFGPGITSVPPLLAFKGRLPSIGHTDPGLILNADLFKEYALRLPLALSCDTLAWSLD